MSSTSYPGTAPLSSVIPFPSRTVGRSQRETTLRGFETAVGAIERAMDFCAVALAVGAASYWVQVASGAHYPQERVFVCAASLGVLMVLLLDKHGDYRPCLSLLAVRETERLLRVTISGFLLALPILLAINTAVPRMVIALAIVTVPPLLAVEKWMVQTAIQAMRGWGAITRKA